MRTFKPWVVVVYDPNDPDDRPKVLGYKNERDAIQAVMELCGIENSDDLEAFHDGQGWYHFESGNSEMLATFQQVSYPVE